MYNSRRSINVLTGRNLRPINSILNKKTIQEIDEDIKYWERHLGDPDLSNIAKNILLSQVKKLRMTKQERLATSHSLPKNIRESFSV